MISNFVKSLCLAVLLPVNATSAHQHAKDALNGQHNKSSSELQNGNSKPVNVLHENHRIARPPSHFPPRTLTMRLMVVLALCLAESIADKYFSTFVIHWYNNLLK